MNAFSFKIHHKNNGAERLQQFLNIQFSIFNFKRMHKAMYFILLLLSSLITFDVSFAQSIEQEIGPAGDEFTFVRIQYENVSGGYDDGPTDRDPGIHGSRTGVRTTGHCRRSG